MAKALITRRRALVGGAAGAGATVVLAACGDTSDTSESASGGVPIVKAVRVDEVPVDDPASETWRDGPETAVVMDAQVMVLPHRERPLVPELKVRALHDGRMIGFLVEWSDQGEDQDTVALRSFRDACAVMLAPGAGDQALRIMGSQTQPATLLHWKADWQRDVDEGWQGLTSAFPNVTVDTYPPLGTGQDVTPATYEAAGVTQWLPGLDAGNELSRTGRTSPVEKLIARGWGTSTTAPTQDARGRGVRTGYGWRVVLAKPLAATDPDEQGIEPGGTATCAFALWGGDQRDAGGRKSPSKVALALQVEQ